MTTIRRLTFVAVLASVAFATSVAQERTPTGTWSGIVVHESVLDSGATTIDRIDGIGQTGKPIGPSLFFAQADTKRNGDDVAPLDTVPDLVQRSRRAFEAGVPIDITGPDQRVPVAVRNACFFPVRNMPRDAPYELFMVPEGGQFFDVQLRNGDPLGVFSADRPGLYTCVVVALVEGKIQRDVHTITVGGSPPPGPDPGPGPGPGPTPPDPTPVVPDGAHGFTKLAYEKAAGLPAANRTKAAALADNFESVASAIAAGTITTDSDALAALVQKNWTTLGLKSQTESRQSPWYPWFIAWQQKADQVEAAGGLPNVNAYAEIFRATADGLRLVKASGLPSRRADRRRQDAEVEILSAILGMQ
jgi:hypothetical protein